MRGGQTEAVVAINPQRIGSGAREFEISDYLFGKVHRAPAWKRIGSGEVIDGVTPIDHCAHCEVSVWVGTVKIGGVRAVQAGELVFRPGQVACRSRIILIVPYYKA